MKNSDRGPEIVRHPVNGIPIPVRRDMGMEQIATECLESVATDQYDGDDKTFEGKTRIEAAVLSLAQDSTVDPRARTEFLDRIMGKPKIKTEALVTTLNLNDYLTQLAAEDDFEHAQAIDADAEVIPDGSTDDEDDAATSLT